MQVRAFERYIPLINIQECTDISKMHDNRTILFFIETTVNYGKCITAARGSLGYIPV